MEKPTLEAFCQKAKDLFMPEILHRSRNRAVAEDIFQDVLTGMIGRWKEIDDPEHYFWKAIANNSQKQDPTSQKTASLDTYSTYVQLAAPPGTDPFFIHSYDQYNEYLNQAIASLPKPKHQRMIANYLLGGVWDKNKKKYVALSPDRYCKKHNVTKNEFFEMIKEVSNNMRRLLDEKINRPLAKRNDHH